MNLIFFAIALISTPPVVCKNVTTALSPSGRLVYRQRVFSVTEPLRDIHCLNGGRCLELQTGDPELRTISRFEFPEDPNAEPKTEVMTQSESKGVPMFHTISDDQHLTAQIFRFKNGHRLTVFDRSTNQRLLDFDLTALFEKMAAEEQASGIINRPELRFTITGERLLVSTPRGAFEFLLNGTGYKPGASFLQSKPNVHFSGHLDHHLFVAYDRNFALLANDAYLPITQNHDSPFATSPMAIWNSRRPRVISRPRSEVETRLGVYRVLRHGSEQPRLSLESFLPKLPHEDEEMNALGPDVIRVYGNSLITYNSEMGSLVQTNLQVVEPEEVP